MSLTGKQSITREAAHALKPENPPIATPADLEKGATDAQWHPPQRRMSVSERASSMMSDAGALVSDVLGALGMAPVRETPENDPRDATILPKHHRSSSSSVGGGAGAGAGARGGRYE